MRWSILPVLVLITFQSFAQPSKLHSRRSILKMVKTEIKESYKGDFRILEIKRDLKDWSFVKVIGYQFNLQQISNPDIVVRYYHSRSAPLVFRRARFEKEWNELKFINRSRQFAKKELDEYFGKNYLNFRLNINNMDEKVLVVNLPYMLDSSQAGLEKLRQFSLSLARKDEIMICNFYANVRYVKSRKLGIAKACQFHYRVDLMKSEEDEMLIKNTIMRGCSDNKVLNK